MRILLLSQNQVVRDMVRLAISDMKVSLEVAESMEEIKHDRYDMLLVDELFAEKRLIREIPKKLLIKESVLLAGFSDENRKFFDKILKKPFLPKDIRVMIEKNMAKLEEEPEEEEEFTLEYFLNEEEKESPEESIFDPEDIAEIRKLLNEEDADISDENIQEEQTENFGTDLEGTLSLETILKMNPKKIRKILKGAEITIRIHFPENE